ncbi:DUF6445 family protein [Bacillus cereus]|uniref:DUF6445 family protein n=1 Tax=Bacillus cereus TaxID=1396 RepID=UPI001F0A17BC|nr:DUF6445 family protein [Bacillus cereus]
MTFLNEDILVIDNFYSDPMKIRKLALNTDYNFFENKANFPGGESIKAFYTEKHIKKFEGLVNRRIHVDPKKYVFGKFRFCTANDNSQTKVHFDKVSWAAIVYLSLNEDCKGGLGIYKHEELDLSTVPSSDELEHLGCKDVFEFDQRYVLPITKEKGSWSLLREIPLKFNRLILIRGEKYFHGITEQFGSNIINSRLSQVFFFNND